MYCGIRTAQSARFEQCAASARWRAEARRAAETGDRDSSRARGVCRVDSALRCASLRGGGLRQCAARQRCGEHRRATLRDAAPCTVLAPPRASKRSRARSSARARLAARQCPRCRRARCRSNCDARVLLVGPARPRRPNLQRSRLLIISVLDRYCLR